jgi:peptidoglycan L-alanyl-D-glutamate endopeptidase CwlK
MQIDNKIQHLHPAFRAKLLQIIEAVEKATKCSWVIVEGYRSQARQDWLYAQGRTRPGPIVTWIKSPRWHGCGLAADLAPTKGGQVWYACPRTYWETLRGIYQAHGLGNPAWSKGDLGHVQSLNKDFQATAKAWCEGGFK